jgi:DNA-binding response OmpR family regulator
LITAKKNILVVDDERDIVNLIQYNLITKPFRMRELIARVKTVIRRKETSRKEKVIKIGDFIIEPVRYEVRLGGNSLTFTPKEFKILLTLASNPGRVFTRNQLMDGVWGDEIVIDRTIDVHIKKIREKLGDFGKYIETIRGVGYRFKEYRW